MTPTCMFIWDPHGAQILIRDFCRATWVPSNGHDGRDRNVCSAADSNVAYKF